MIDLTINSTDGASDVRAQTTDGEEFLNGWAGALTQVIDSDHIVIPRETLPEFVSAAEERNLTVEQSVDSNAPGMALRVYIELGNDAMVTPKNALDALDRAFVLGHEGSPYDNYVIGDAGPIMDVNGNTVGRWFVDVA